MYASIKDRRAYLMYMIANISYVNAKLRIDQIHSQQEFVFEHQNSVINAGRVLLFSTLISSDFPHFCAVVWLQTVALIVMHAGYSTTVYTLGLSWLTEMLQHVMAQPWVVDGFRTQRIKRVLSCRSCIDGSRRG